VAGVGSAHHVLCVEHLLGELGHGQCAVLLRATRGQGREANHEEMETREGHNVHSELAEIGVELSRETERAGHARHDSGHKVVKIAEGGGGQLQGTEANIVQRLVVNAKHLVGVLDKLVHRERGVVRLHHSVRHLRRGHDGEGQHNAVGVLFTNLGDEESAHAGAGATTERMRELEALEAIARLSLLAHNVKHGVDKLSALGVVTLGPVVTRASLAEDEVVRAEDLAVGTGAHRVHGTRLKIHEHGAGHIATTSGLIEVHIDALELEIGVAVVGTGGVDACENKATSRQHHTKGIPAMQTLHHALRRHYLTRALPTSRCSVAPSPTGRPTAGVQRRTGNPKKSKETEFKSRRSPCSSEITSQNLAPIWLPHCPPWIWTISRMLVCWLRE